MADRAFYQARNETYETCRRMLRGAGLTDYAQTVWWSTPSSWMDGKVPLQALQEGQNEQLTNAVRRFASAGESSPMGRNQLLISIFKLPVRDEKFINLYRGKRHGSLRVGRTVIEWAAPVAPTTRTNNG